MRKVLIMLVLSLLLTGCNDLNNNFETIMKENEYIIIDVRTKDEYNESHLVGSINIPYDEIDQNTNLDKEKLIFVYCKSGNRSSIALKRLSNLGYNVYNLGSYSEIDMPKE